MRGKEFRYDESPAVSMLSKLSSMRQQYRTLYFEPKSIEFPHNLIGDIHSRMIGPSLAIASAEIASGKTLVYLASPGDGQNISPQKSLLNTWGGEQISDFNLQNYTDQSIGYQIATSLGFLNGVSVEAPKRIVVAFQFQAITKGSGRPIFKQINTQPPIYSNFLLGEILIAVDYDGGLPTNFMSANVSGDITLFISNPRAEGVCYEGDERNPSIREVNEAKFKLAWDMAQCVLNSEALANWLQKNK